MRLNESSELVCLVVLQLGYATVFSTLIYISINIVGGFIASHVYLTFMNSLFGL